MIAPGHGVLIPDDELKESFFQSAGPGGQNVNKVATAVRLSFDLAHSPSIPEHWRAVLLRKLAARVDSRGMIAVVSRKYRTQADNRAAAAERLTELLSDSLVVQAKRHATKPTRGSVERRLNAKKQHAQVKSSRRAANWSND